MIGRLDPTAGVFVSTGTRVFAPSDRMSTSMTSVASLMPFAVANRTAYAFCSTAPRSLLGKLDGLTRRLLEPVSRIHTVTPLVGDG